MSSPTGKYTNGAIARRQKAPTTPTLSRREKLFAFLSTPLGLWLLSALFIYFSSWVYSNYSEQLSKRTQDSSRIDLLDQEVERRLYLFYPLYATAKADRLLDKYSVEDQLAFPRDAVKQVFGKPSAENELHPELRERNLMSLMYELRGLLRRVDSFESECVGRAIDFARKVEPFWRNRKLEKIEEFRAFYRDLERIRDNRWSPDAQNQLVPYQYARITGGDVVHYWSKYNCLREREHRRIKGEIPDDF